MAATPHAQQVFLHQIDSQASQLAFLPSCTLQATAEVLAVLQSDPHTQDVSRHSALLIRATRLCGCICCSGDLNALTSMVLKPASCLLRFLDAAVEDGHSDGLCHRDTQHP
jgi:hypothetical protein